MRLRIAIASSSVFSPGASFSQSSWPKYACPAPAARIRKSYESVPSARRTSRRDDVDRDDIGEEDARVRLAAEDRADRIRDVAGRETRRRDLVEERLEEMVIAPVDDRQPDRRIGESPGGGETAETGADHDDFGPHSGGAHPRPTLSF